MKRKETIVYTIPLDGDGTIAQLVMPLPLSKRDIRWVQKWLTDTFLVVFEEA